MLVAVAISSNINADGYIKNGVHYLYVDDNDNSITCNVEALCDIALVKNDIFVNWIMTRGAMWSDSAIKKTSYNDNDGITHVVIQAVGEDANNPVILVSRDYQYHFNLVATERKTINKYMFVEHKTNEFNAHNAVIDDGLELDFNNKKLFGEYNIKGDVKSVIHPLSIFNDGKKTYIQMSNEISTTDLPTVYAVSDDDKLLTTASRYRKPYFIVDGVKPNYALIVGSSTSDNQLRVDIRLKKSRRSWFR
jgi:type IV secretory pathway VirB9-like protein